MDASYMNPFIAAIRNVFDTMIDVPYTLGEPNIKNDSTSSYEVSGIIGISGDVLACVRLNLPEAIALQLASAMLGIELTEVDDDCTDAIGEITNILAGDAKKDFPKSNTTVSVPSVIVGRHRIAFPKGVPIFSIPGETDKGAFSVDVALKPA